MGCKAAEGDFVISEIAKWAVLKGLPARKMTNMTIMTNDSVISWARKGWWKCENYTIIIYNIYIIYNNEFRTEYSRKGVWGKMTIVICHNCHFLVERCLDTLLNGRKMTNMTNDSVIFLGERMMKIWKLYHYYI